VKTEQRERKEQGPDVAGPRAYSLALLEPMFDARTSESVESNDGRGFVEVFRSDARSFVEVFRSGYGRGLITCDKISYRGRSLE